MNAAKAKAAAKQRALAAKTKAATAAAAAKEAATPADQTASSAASGSSAAAATSPASSRAAVSSRPRPSVTQYWGDSAASTPAPGGGIHRIGYDQATFEQVVQSVIVDATPLTPVKVEDDTAEEGEEKVQIRKEDIEFLRREMECDKPTAERWLRRGKDLQGAIWIATGPDA